MSTERKKELVQQILKLECALFRSNQILDEYEERLFEYSQLPDLNTGSSLIIELTEQMNAEYKRYNADLDQHEELRSELGKLKLNKPLEQASSE